MGINVITVYTLALTISVEQTTTGLDLNYLTSYCMCKSHRWFDLVWISNKRNLQRLVMEYITPPEDGL